jgi:hypothetical protein
MSRMTEVACKNILSDLLLKKERGLDCKSAPTKDNMKSLATDSGQSKAPEGLLYLSMLIKEYKVNDKVIL